MAGVTPAESKQKDIIFDSADLYYGDFPLSGVDTWLTDIEAKKLGINNSGISLKLSNDIYNIQIAHSNDKNIKGYQRVLKIDGTVEGEVIKFNTDLLTMSLYEEVTSGITSTKYTALAISEGEIKQEKYKQLLMVANKGDEVWLVLFNNTYNSNGLEIDTKGGEEAVAKVKFDACYDPEDLTLPPVYIFIPKTVAPASLSLDDNKTPTK